jgi:hypothetical protein
MLSLYRMHIIYMFQIAAMIPYVSTLIILDHFLFFQLLVNHLPGYLLLAVNICRPILCNVPSRRARFHSFTASYPPLCFRLITFTFFPCFLRIIRPTFALPFASRYIPSF